MAARLSLTLTESDVNVANNTSKVTAKLYYYGNGVSYNNNNPSGTIIIDGTSYSFNHDFSTSTSAQLLATKSKTVTHNSDGSKTVSVSATFKTGVSLGTLSTSKSITLTKIARATQHTLSPTSVTLGGTQPSVTISMPRASSAFTHTLSYTIGSTTATIASGLGTSYTWNPPVNILNSITGGMSGTVTVTCKTYNGSTLIGTKTANLTVNVHANIKPSISSVSIAEAVSAVSSNFSGKYIQNKSQLNVSITAAGAYSSTISSYSTSIDGVTYLGNAFTSNVLNTSGSKTITITVRDSRGQESSTTRTINVLPYFTPVITNMTYEHINSTTTRITISGSVAPVNNGTNNLNTKTLTLKYKPISATTFSSPVTVSTNSWNFNVPYEVTGIDVDTTYEYVAVLSDKFGPSPEYPIKTGTIVLSRKAGGTGITLFEEATEDGFVVGGGKDSRFTGDITLPNIYVNSMAGQVYFNKNDTKLYGKYTDGTSREIMTTCYTDDAFSVGYGGYKDSVGKTSLYGNDIQLRCNNNLAFYVGANSMKPYFAPGDTYDAYWYGAGFLTDSKTKVYFTLPLAKPMLGVSAVTVSSGTDGGFILRQNDKYTHGSALNARKKPSSYAVTARYMYVGFGICAEFATTTNAVNNSAIGINWRGTITFS